MQILRADLFWNSSVGRSAQFDCQNPINRIVIIYAHSLSMNRTQISAKNVKQIKFDVYEHTLIAH